MDQKSRRSHGADAELWETEPLLRAEEIAQISATTEGPAKCLAALVRLVQVRFQIDACSTYLLEPDRSTLVLAATVGLKPESVGHVRMKLHEGLTGMVAEQMAPLAVEDAARHRRYKYFPEAGEELFPSFLGVPLVDRGQLQGVLTVQTREARTFGEAEIKSLEATARQLAPVIGEARKLEQFITPTQQRLWALARNLWWCWDAETIALFRDLDPVRWRELGHNPIALLSELSLEKLEHRTNQLVLHSRISYAHRRLEEYLHDEDTWGETHAVVLRSRPVAYFSAEFGMHESVPIYSGGLGVLSGDHLKSASDLDVPLVAIGLFYDQGYFRQRLDADGWQVENYLQVDLDQLPLTPATTPNGRPITLSIETRTGVIQAKVWQLQVGRRQLLLLDSDVEGNSPEDRELTARLYGGDGRVRIRQELLLGVGGARALRAAGINPGVLHLNEGHSAFAVLDEIRHRMQSEGLTFRGSGDARLSVHRLHDPHAGAGRTRSLRRGAGGRTSGTVARRAGTQPRAFHELGTSCRGQRGRIFLHDGAGDQAFAACECRVVTAR